MSGSSGKVLAPGCLATPGNLATQGRVVVALVLSMLPGVALANMVWPALILEARLVSGWVIVASLVVEYAFARRLFALSSGRTAFAVAMANLFSTLIGWVLLPLVGLLEYWIIGDLLPGAILGKMLGAKWEADPATWAAPFLTACVANAFLEGLVYEYGFNVGLRFRSRVFGWIIVANAVTVTAALLSLALVPLTRGA